jgi:glutamate formiminotransferase / 5-formyltetrahydrofolate cyclo-ligase
MGPYCIGLVPGVFEAVPNFSEGRDAAVIAELAGDGALDVHADPAHHRCVVTLAACGVEGLLDLVVSRVEVAVRRLSLRGHEGLHPRVGVADVLPVVPLGSASWEQAADAARTLAWRVWSELGVPVYFYGALAGGRRLAEIRRGGVPLDVGSPPHPTAGACCVGVRPPLVAYNLLLPLSAGDVRALVPRVRELPGVQALSFALPDGRVQISLNLTDLGAVGVAGVFAEVVRLAEVPPAAVEPELVGLCPAAAAGRGCDGGLLEGRVAALAGVRAAEACAAAGGDERERVAARLRGSAEALRALRTEPSALLSGAEQAAALRRVVRAAGVTESCTETLLAFAAKGLLAALDPATRARFGDRVVLLERWLAED